MDVARHPNLVLWLPLWRKDGLSVRSDDAYGRLCTLSGTGMLWTPQGGRFNGTDQLVTIPDGPSLLDLPEYTVEALFKPTGWGEGSGGRILGKAAGLWQFDLVAANSACTFIRGYSLANASATTANNAIVLNNRYHAVGRFSTTTNECSLWLNGVDSSATVVAGDGSLSSDAGNIVIGNNAGGSRTFAGTISFIRIYNRMLTNGEVMQNYLASKDLLS